MYRNSKELYKIAIILVLSVFYYPVFSQDVSSVSDVKDVAHELFIQKKYAKAKELYSQLLSLSPKDENFNYRFGACALFVDEDKVAPLKYLEYAISKPGVDPEAYYFLGKGYHYNYRFDDAITYFNMYKDKVGKKSEVSRRS